VACAGAWTWAGSGLRGGLFRARLLHQAAGDLQHFLVAAAADHAVLAVDDHGRGAVHAAADHELAAPVDLGIGGETVHGGAEFLRVGAQLAVPLRDRGFVRLLAPTGPARA